MRRRAVLIAVGTALALALVALTASVFAVTRSAPEGQGYRGSSPPVGIELAAFSLRSYRGPVVSNDSLSGKVVALTLLESKCKEACPVIAFQVARGMEHLSREQREGVRAIAISTHPVDDTPASVRTFLEKQGAVDALDYPSETSASFGLCGSATKSCRRSTQATLTPTRRRCTSTTEAASGFRRCTQASISPQTTLPTTLRLRSGAEGRHCP